MVIKIDEAVKFETSGKGKRRRQLLGCKKSDIGMLFCHLEANNVSHKSVSFKNLLGLLQMSLIDSMRMYLLLFSF